jgi:hypothetical protein
MYRSGTGARLTLIRFSAEAAKEENTHMTAIKTRKELKLTMTPYARIVRGFGRSENCTPLRIVRLNLVRQGSKTD